METLPRRFHILAKLVIADSCLILLVLFLVMLRPNLLVFLAPAFLTIALISNTLYLRRASHPASVLEASRKPKITNRQRINSYLVSVIFILGFIRGIFMFAHGELPLILSPILLVPLFMAVYCAKVGYKNFHEEP